MRAEFATMAVRQMEAMRQRWEKSGCTDTACLRAALLLCGATAPLPSWAVWGLLKLIDKQIEQMQWPYYGARWMLVREALARGSALMKLTTRPACGFRGRLPPAAAT